MPKTIVLEDGHEEVVYSEEEVKPFQESAAKAEELSNQFDKLKTEMGVGEGQTVEEKLAELKENANPNFARYRTKFNSMEKELKKVGKEFAEDGTIITDKQVSLEDVRKVAEEATVNALARTNRDKALSQFTSEDKKVVEYYLDKLEATGGDFKENFELAISKAFPDRSSDIIRNSAIIGSGQGPLIKPVGTSFTSTEEGKAMLNDLAPKKN